MTFRTPARLLAAWLATLAMLVAGLAPALLHAEAGARRAGLVEVCGAQGSKWIRVDVAASHPTPAPESRHVGKHCASCCLHAQPVALPAAPAIAGVAQARHERPRVASTAPPPRVAWIGSQPRAPPFLS